MINQKHTNTIFYTAIIFFGGLFFIACDSGSKSIPKYNDEIDLTKDVAHDVSIILSQKAKTQTFIKAPLLVRNENIVPNFAEMPNGLEADFFNEEGIISTHLKADYARYYEREQNVILQKNVVVTNADSTVLKTDELIWNNKLEKFYTDKPVHIERKDQIITGNGLEANKDLTEVKILQQKSVIPMNDSTGFGMPDGRDTDSLENNRRDMPSAPNVTI